ncbi:phage tail protein [Escherichia coli]|uniref:phage tail protein n=1 Tax=Escherichia coli TaxID=562 RepID=UPI0022DD3D3E|nr:phage tail protein [Escherichia coli]
MSTKFYTLLTDIGAAKLASAAALGVPLKITHMAVGDGGGVLPTPDARQTALVNEKRRAALNMLYIDPQNSSQIIAEQVIPENEGGWWIREVGLFDESGALIAVGNCPESYKPQLAEGSGRTQTVRMVLITSSTDNITLKIDPAVVLATRKYVDDKALELKVYADDQMAKHLAAPDPHSQYAPKASPTFTGTPKAPTPAAGNNTTQVATTAFVQAALTALINGAPATLDTLKEIAAAINNDPNFSTTINNALALKAPLSSPALTGTPTAPTAAQSVNNTQIATTAFVKSAIAGMVGSAPAALDTLNELAAALGNDPNFATTMLNALAGKQPLDNMLTNLSGKDVAGLLTYLRLAEAGNTSGKLALIGNVNTDTDKCAVVTKTGSNANGKYRIWSDGTIEVWGNAVANISGNAAVYYPISLPAPAQVITTTPLLLSSATPYKVRVPMVITDLTDATKATFLVLRSDGTTSADGFYWSARYAPF